MGCTPGDEQWERGPPLEAEQQQRRREPDGEVDEPTGDEVHRDVERRPGHAEVEVARHGEVVGQFRPLEVGDAGGRHARRHQPVVQMRGQ
ncbi:MAG: hypothetical protein AB7U39_06130 [Ilumatobacteraceae bacterium]